MRTSNHLIGAVNFLTFVLSIPILGGGIWLSSHANNTDCPKFLQWPLIIIGVSIMGSGQPVMNRAYLDYSLQDYSGWLWDRVASDSYWGKIGSCIRDSRACRKMGRNIGGVPESAEMFYIRKLSPIEGLSSRFFMPFVPAKIFSGRGFFSPSSPYVASSLSSFFFRYGFTQFTPPSFSTSCSHGPARRTFLLATTYYFFILGQRK
ncbi:hypothetical protein MIMGU_mgv1a024206mg [Erythranthe guttata]|uniref:Uncharacterized protein n=1 Tax=Erythranthe guttata TaxID=4155 RepID=A0A022R5B8_ERYGU|nr:hypothetical protein MIMGU_mgv1a024206mg [Erythranthe guttata]